MLWNRFASCSSTLAEHRWQVLRLCIDLLLAASLSHVVFKGVRVDDGFDVHAAVIDHIVGGGEVSLFKSVLGGAMAHNQVVLHATLPIDHRLVVISVLFLGL